MDKKTWDAYCESVLLLSCLSTIIITVVLFLYDFSLASELFKEAFSTPKALLKHELWMVILPYYTIVSILYIFYFARRRAAKAHQQTILVLEDTLQDLKNAHSKE